MPISFQKARALCTDHEYALFRGSLPSNIAALSPAALRRDAVRARTIRDKYRTLAERQEREAQGRTKPRGKRPAAGAANTKLKAQLFDEARTRYEARLETIERRAAQEQRAATGKTAIRKKAEAAAKTAAPEAPWPKPGEEQQKRRPRPRVGKGSLAAELAQQRSRMQRSGSRRIRTHVSALGRRRQARRDSRSR